MSSRRKFLVQGGLATTALLAAKPFKTVARAGSPLTGYSYRNKVLVLHTADLHNANHDRVVDHISGLKRAAGNIILLDAGKKNSSSIKYDASIDQCNPVSADDYRIVYKGESKIGIITASNEFGQVNSLASYLKKEKNCHLVICLSQLGYRNKNGIDDVNLAKASKHVDIIICGDAKNSCKDPAIVLNKDNSEVIIDHAGDTAIALGKIEITFNDKGQKWNIAFKEAQNRKLTA